jgi:hypothetical protein
MLLDTHISNYNEKKFKFNNESFTTPVFNLNANIETEMANNSSLNQH